MKKLLWKGTVGDVYELARWMHERYEEHAKRAGWETQTITRVAFDDLPDENKTVMMSLAQDLIVRQVEWAISKIDQHKIADTTRLILSGRSHNQLIDEIIASVRWEAAA